MIAVDAGTFLMGSPKVALERSDDDSPQHEVRLAAFEFAETEVTFDQYDR